MMGSVRRYGRGGSEDAQFGEVTSAVLLTSYRQSYLTVVSARRENELRKNAISVKQPSHGKTILDWRILIKKVGVAGRYLS